MAKRRMLIVVVLAVSVAGASASGRSEQRREIPPRSLSDYGSWRVLSALSEVPVGTWALCRPQDPNWDASVQKAHGPHAKRYIRVYANDLAISALDAGTTPLPKGAIIAKEKLSSGDAAAHSGVAFMIKNDVRQFPETSGWEFSYYPSRAAGRADTQQSCTQCHKAALETDFVVGTYPKLGAPAAQQ